MNYCYNLIIALIKSSIYCLFMKLFLLFLILLTNAKPNIQYPIRLTYINKINSWWPVSDIAKGMGVPGYAKPNIYNYFCLTVWTYSKGPLDLAKLWGDPVTYLSEQSDFGRSNTQIRDKIKKKYSDANKKLLVSAFAQSEYPTTAGIDPLLCATKLALFINDVNIDGVDVNYQDNKAFQDGKAQIWLIEFTKKLRQLLPNHIICHTPQSSYFHHRYKNGGYTTVHYYVGDLIDFYNVQYYNQMNEKFDTYESLFLSSLNSSSVQGTSVKQLHERGIPLNKIVIGKPVDPINVKNSGWVDPKQLSQFFVQGYQGLGWYAGVMFWEYYSDPSGEVIQQVMGNLTELYLFSKLFNILEQTSIPQNNNNIMASKIAENNKIPSLSSLSTLQTTTNSPQFSEIQYLTTSSQHVISSESQGVAELFNPRSINYPVRFTIVDRLASWWPPEAIAASLGVPGFANDTLYNYFSLSTWTYKKGLINLAKVWTNATKYFSNSSQFGTTNQQIRTNIKKKYNSNGVALLISAFSSSQNPVSDGVQALSCATKLAQYVLDNQLDGVQINFKDRNSFQKGLGQFWLIRFTSKLRELLPNHIIVHTAMASLFNQADFRIGGYVMINRAVGNQIDFYNILFYDHGSDMPFDSFNNLFLLSGPPRKFGTSIRQLIIRGIPSHKIVIGKPVLEQDTQNTGWMNAQSLKEAIIQGYKGMRWFAGIIYWQYFSDLNGRAVKSVMQELILLCKAKNNCKP